MLLSQLRNLMGSFPPECPQAQPQGSAKDEEAGGGDGRQTLAGSASPADGRSEDAPQVKPEDAHIGGR